MKKIESESENERERGKLYEKWKKNTENVCRFWCGEEKHLMRWMGWGEDGKCFPCWKEGGFGIFTTMLLGLGETAFLSYNKQNICKHTKKSFLIFFLFSFFIVRCGWWWGGVFCCCCCMLNKCFCRQFAIAMIHQHRNIENIDTGLPSSCFML